MSNRPIRNLIFLYVDEAEYCLEMLEDDLVDGDNKPDKVQMVESLIRKFKETDTHNGCVFSLSRVNAEHILHLVNFDLDCVELTPSERVLAVGLKQNLRNFIERESW